MKGYKIAGLTVNMETFGRALQHAEKYLISEQPYDQPQITINVSEIRRKSYIESIPNCSEDVAEYMLSGRDFYRQLIDFDGFMLHASAVVYEDRAYLFSANSGVGKSTHTSLWCKAFPQAYILNDDKPAVRLIDGELYACGTPWNGKGSLNVNECVKLGGICFLHRSEKNEISEMKTNIIIQNLLIQTIRFGLKEPEFTKIFALWDRLLNEYAIYDLGCLPDTDAVNLSYKTLKGSKK